tara:strand:- start:1896 stop:4562 length:2667 start_codon:yes stop_codon:yes gene_type:complete
MRFFEKKVNYKFKILLLISIVLLSIIFLFPKKYLKENLAQNIRIYTCQPNFTNITHDTAFKIKRLFFGFVNTIRKGCKYEKLVINISYKNFEKIKEDRKLALKLGNLTKPREVPGSIIFKNKKYRSDIRLKGDLANHWAVNKQWSLRIELKNGESINGMKEFSITKLAERNFPDNLIISNQFKRLKIITPEFKIYKTQVNGQNWGLMIAEEQFSNVFLENRKLKDGLIFKFTNEADFKIRNYLEKKNILPRTILMNKQGKVEVDVYNKKKLNKINFLNNQRSIIRSINESLNSNKDNLYKSRIVGQFFDEKKMANLLANVLVFNSIHTLYSNNVRFYLNPYNLIIEPIPTDNVYNLSPKNSEFYKKELKKEIKEYANVNYIYKLLFSKKSFKQEYNNSLKEIYLNLKNIKRDSVEICKNFDKYCEKIINFQDLEKNILKLIELGDTILPVSDSIKKPKKNVLKKKISTNLDELDAIKIYNNYIYARLFDNYLKVYNNTLDKIILNDIVLYQDNNTKKCNAYRPENCTIKKYNLNISLNNEEEILHNKIDLKNAKNVVWAKINGNVKNQNFNYVLNNENKNFDEINIIKQKTSYNKQLKNLKNQTYIIKGKIIISEPIILPKNFDLKIEPGSELIFEENAYIYLNGGNLNIDGKTETIKLLPKEKNWKGIYVNNSKKSSIIRNATISSTNNFEHKGIYLTGGINFYNSNVEISNTNILNSECEDAINIINSKFKLTNTRIINSSSDGIDSDFSNGIIKNSYFEKIGGDAIDTSGSRISIINTKINNVTDKGLSAGEKSEIYLENFFVNAARFGLVSKDLSKVNGKKISITNSDELDILAFEKKMHYGPGFINLDNVSSNNKILSQKNSSIVIDKKLIKNKTFNPKKFYQ